MTDMTDLWPEFSFEKTENNKAIEILRAQARLLERKTFGRVKATFSKINYKPGNTESISGALISMALIGEPKVEVLDKELLGKTDANELYNFQRYKFEIYNETYRFRIFVLKNRIVFPIQLDIDEGIRKEINLGENTEIHSNTQLMEVVSSVFASRKLGTIIMQMIDEE